MTFDKLWLHEDGDDEDAVDEKTATMNHSSLLALLSDCHDFPPKHTNMCKVHSPQLAEPSRPI